MKGYLIAGIAIAILIIPLPVPADTLIVFGDGLSDNGGNDGYGITRFSNGYVWADYLADSNHLNCSLYNYAFGGAATGNGFPHVNWQVDQYLLNKPVAPDSERVLFTVQGGGNDLLWRMVTGQDPASAVEPAAANVTLAVEKLIHAGARHIGVWNMADIAASPAFNWNPAYSEYFRGVIRSYNEALGTALSPFQATPGVNVFLFDQFGFIGEVLSSPQAYGFDNTSDALLCAGPTTDRFLWWSGIHLATGAHALLADAYCEQFRTVVPIPAPIILFGTGLMGILGIGRILRKKEVY